MTVAVGIAVEVGVAVEGMDVAVGCEEHDAVTNMEMIKVKKMRRMANPSGK